MIPELISIGPFTVHSFGLLMVIAFLSAGRVLALSLSAAGEDPNLAEPMVTWAAIGGLIGARLFYILTFPNHFLADPLGAVFSGAGFVFYGGFIGGALACYMYVRRKGKRFLYMADLTSPALAVGYGIGRVGCQLSGDGDYGIASTLPWAASYLVGVVPTVERVHPTPVYETILALLLAIVLIKLLKTERLRAGYVFGVYLAFSAVCRFFIEYIRIEPKVAMALTEAQLIAVVLLLLGALLCFRARSPVERSDSLQ